MSFESFRDLVMKGWMGFCDRRVYEQFISCDIMGYLAVDVFPFFSQLFLASFLSSLLFSRLFGLRFLLSFLHRNSTRPQTSTCSPGKLSPGIHY